MAPGSGMLAAWGSNDILVVMGVLPVTATHWYMGMGHYEGNRFYAVIDGSRGAMLLSLPLEMFC